METERLNPASIIKNNPKIDKTITFTNATQDLTRRARTSLWEPKNGKARNTSFFGTVAIGAADLFFCLGSKHD